MVKKGFNKIEAFLERVSWEKDKLDREIMKGKSLKILQAYLKGIGLETDTKVISRYIESLPLAIREQRKTERGLKKRVTRKLSHYFIRPQLPQVKECSHEKTFSRWVWRDEEPKVQLVCLKCKEVIAEFDSEEHEKRMNRDPRLQEIYRRLARRKRER